MNIPRSMSIPFNIDLSSFTYQQLPEVSVEEEVEQCEIFGRQPTVKEEGYSEDQSSYFQGNYSYQRESEVARSGSLSVDSFTLQADLRLTPGRRHTVNDVHSVSDRYDFRHREDDCGPMDVGVMPLVEMEVDMRDHGSSNVSRNATTRDPVHSDRFAYTTESVGAAPNVSSSSSNISLEDRSPLMTSANPGLEFLEGELNGLVKRHPDHVRNREDDLGLRVRGGSGLYFRNGIEDEFNVKAPVRMIKAPMEVDGDSELYPTSAITDQLTEWHLVPKDAFDMAPTEVLDSNASMVRQAEMASSMEIFRTASMGTFDQLIGDPLLPNSNGSYFGNEVADYSVSEHAAYIDTKPGRRMSGGPWSAPLTTKGLIDGYRSHGQWKDLPRRERSRTVAVSKERRATFPTDGPVSVDVAQKGDTVSVQPKFAAGHDDAGSFAMINLRRPGAWKRNKSSSGKSEKKPKKAELDEHDE